METKQTMMKYHQIKVTLSSGVEIMLKVNGQDYYATHEWLDSLPGISGYEDMKSTAPIKPHITQRMKDKVTKIAIARLNAGLTQQELADKVGVSRTQVVRWERGPYNVRLDRLKRIAEVLNVEWTSLIDNEVSRIAIARANAGLTQQELADKIGVKTTQVARWEKSFNHIQPDALKRIAKALNVEWTDLIEEE